MITLGCVNQISRYYGGRAFDQPILELAQEHFLLWMVREGLFANGPEDVVFKGGTALRKFRLALRGRFSTDLDFAVARMAERVTDRSIRARHGRVQVLAIQARQCSITLSVPHDLCR